MEPLPPDMDHDPKVLKSWARRTGFKSNPSYETVSIASDAEIFNVETFNSSAPSPTPDPLQGGAGHAMDLEVGKGKANNDGNKETGRIRASAPLENANGATPVTPAAFVSTATKDADLEAPKVMPNVEFPQIRHKSKTNIMSLSQDADDAMLLRQSHMKYELQETPELVPLIFYGLQHYLSLAGSLVLIPLIIVPVMGGTAHDTARVVSFVLFMYGVTTLLHSYFG